MLEQAARPSRLNTTSLLPIHKRTHPTRSVTPARLAAVAFPLLLSTLVAALVELLHGCVCPLVPESGPKTVRRGVSPLPPVLNPKSNSDHPLFKKNSQSRPPSLHSRSISFSTSLCLSTCLPVYLPVLNVTNPAGWFGDTTNSQR